MTSVDSGVETGNDSNDSAQTESQSNNQGFHRDTTMNTSEMNTCTEIQSMQEQETDANKLDMRRSTTTSTIIWSPDNSMSLTSQTNLNLLENNFVFNVESGDTETLQFKTPPKFLIHPKLLKQTISITCPHSYFSGGVSLSNFDQDLKPVSFRVSPVHRSKRQELRGKCWRTNIPYRGRQMRLAAATNNIETIQRLLEMGISPNNHDEQGRSPLHLASCRGYTEIVKLLLDYGANPNQIDCIGNTPLHLAAVTSKGSVVKLLLNAGTNVGSSDRHGYNPLQLALTKLRMLQNCSGSDMNRVKDEVHKIVGMLLTYLQKQKDACDQIETLTSFCSRISLSNTTDQVQDDVKELLASIDALSLTN